MHGTLAADSAFARDLGHVPHILYKQIRPAVNCFLLHLFSWEVSDFSCNRCPQLPDGSHAPRVLVGDGTAVCVQKIHMPAVTVSEDEPLPSRASESGLLLCISGNRVKVLIKAYLVQDSGLTAVEFEEMLGLLKTDHRANGLHPHPMPEEPPISIGPALAALLASRQPLGGGETCGVPRQLHGLVRNLAAHSLVTGIIPFSALSVVREVLLSDPPPSCPAEALRRLFAHVPVLAEWMTARQVANAEEDAWRMFPLEVVEMRLVQALINHAMLAYQAAPIVYPAGKVTSMRGDLCSAQETAFVPALPRRVRVGAFDCDAGRDSNDCKNPQGGRHGSLAPGVFLICCEHGVCWGFNIMETPESGREFFTLLRERYPVSEVAALGTGGPSIVVYDNACHLEVGGPQRWLAARGPVLALGVMLCEPHARIFLTDKLCMVR